VKLQKVFYSYWFASSDSLKPFVPETENSPWSQNHRIVGAGRHLWRSSSPPPAKAGSPRAGCTGPCPGGSLISLLESKKLFSYQKFLLLKKKKSFYKTLYPDRCPFALGCSRPQGSSAALPVNTNTVTKNYFLSKLKGVWGRSRLCFWMCLLDEI